MSHQACYTRYMNIGQDYHDVPGIHVRAIKSDEQWEAEFRNPKSVVHSKPKKTKHNFTHCPQCDRMKDSACFRSHQQFDKPGPAQPICNACRADNKKLSEAL